MQWESGYFPSIERLDVEIAAYRMKQQAEDIVSLLPSFHIPTHGDNSPGIVPSLFRRRWTQVSPVKSNSPGREA